MAGLEDLYREIILDHYRSPRNRGELETPPAHRFEGFNPLCGDEVVVYLDIADDIVRDVRIAGQGCSISQSSASMMSAAVKGASVAEARKLVSSFNAMISVHESHLEDHEIELVDTDELGEIAALQGIVKYPVRVKCATLSWNTLARGLDEIEAEEATAPSR